MGVLQMLKYYFVNVEWFLSNLTGIIIFALVIYLLQSVALYQYFIAIGRKKDAYKMWIPVVRDYELLMMAELPDTWLYLLLGMIFPIIGPICAVLYYIIYNIVIYRIVKKYNYPRFAIPAVILSVFSGTILFYIYLLLILLKKSNIRKKRKT
jgi:hypothetical protein